MSSSVYSCYLLLLFFFTCKKVFKHKSIEYLYFYKFRNIFDFPKTVCDIFNSIAINKF